MSTPLEDERARLRRATTALHASLDIREHLLGLPDGFENVRVVLSGASRTEGVVVEIPRQALERLVEVLESMGDRQEPQVMPLAKELSTGEVAELLGVTRGHVVQLIDNGVLPAHRVGPRRRVRLSAALAYVRQQQRLTDLPVAAPPEPNGESSDSAPSRPAKKPAPRRRKRPDTPISSETREVVRRYAKLRPPPVGPDHPAG